MRTADRSVGGLPPLDIRIRQRGRRGRRLAPSTRGISPRIHASPTCCAPASPAPPPFAAIVNRLEAGRR